MKKFFLLFVLGVFQFSGYGQNAFQYKSLPDKYARIIQAGADNTTKGLTSTTASETNGSEIDLTALLPQGFVKDGTVDYTQYMQKGLDEYSTITFPDFPVMINASGLNVKSNSSLSFPVNSLLVMQPNDTTHYEMLRLHNVENVVISHPKIKGDREKHRGVGGEWGMGIALRSANNIQIIHPQISHCWGDGIYIGRMYNHKASNSVTITGGHIDYNRRNGISIVSGENIIIDCVTISNTEGTLPMCGIDIEPNYHNDEVKNITINNVITYNNAKSGIMIDLKRLPGELVKEVNINISNHIDEISATGFYISNVAKPNTRAVKPLNGQIIIHNSTLINNITPVNTGRDISLLPQTTISRMNVEKRGSRSLQNLKSRAQSIQNLHVID